LEKRAPHHPFEDWAVAVTGHSQRHMCECLSKFRARTPMRTRMHATHEVLRKHVRFLA